ncbi:glycosyltransferase family 2 protein [Arenicella xantha]|uniref:Glycosyltransferase involved in cell wall biosynthesis n=1 Tax=Arenicella xantha TaxID=644221 RepID=A0A395JL44_9GAMM|nr:glycosyltransferase family 2 protein [Arenicella xantha]RBP48446.1 glycosyltransferase involved in cell wall biosynthesis [Arenicella xantha]
MDVSIVIPFLNESPNLKPLCDEIKTAMDTIDKQYEVIFIDDGSTDDGCDVLASCRETMPQIKVVSFRRNFGQTAAMVAGLDYAQGDIVVTLDADRQNDPADIPALIAKIEEGYDMVCGWRFDRQDTYLSRKLPSMLANRLISKITDVRLHDYGCTLKAMRKELAKRVTLYGEMHRFIPAVASGVGAKMAEVKVNHRARTAGESKYGISRTFRVVLDLITVKFLLRYHARPLHFFGMPGLALGGIGGALIAYLTVARLFFGVPLGDRPLLIFAFMLLIIGLQFILFGLIGEMQTRTYYESQNKPIYHVRNTIGIETDDTKKG